MLRIGGRALRTPALVTMAASAFVALAVFGLPFPLVVLGAGVAGWGLGRWRADLLAVPERAEPEPGVPPLVPDDALHTARPTLRRNLGIVLGGGVLWVLPVVVAWVLAGDSVYVDQGLFFGGMALVTFGGAYAVLAYVAQAAVGTYSWLTAGEMVRGLALAETTPGPLIMVVQFVAFLGAFRDPGGLDPWVAAVIGSLVTVWVTFVPCFIFIFLGAPYVERLRGNATLSAALTGVTAAVVGVIANLAVYFAVHTLFTRTTAVEWGPVSLSAPVWSTFAWDSFAVGVVAFLLVFAARWSVLRTLGACAVLGMAVGLLS